MQNLSHFKSDIVKNDSPQTQNPKIMTNVKHIQVVSVRLPSHDFRMNSTDNFFYTWAEIVLIISHRI